MRCFRLLLSLRENWGVVQTIWSCIECPSFDISNSTSLSFSNPWSKVEDGINTHLTWPCITALHFRDNACVTSLHRPLRCAIWPNLPMGRILLVCCLMAEQKISVKGCIIRNAIVNTNFMLVRRTYDWIRRDSLHIETISHYDLFMFNNSATVKLGCSRESKCLCKWSARSYER